LIRASLYVLVFLISLGVFTKSRSRTVRQSVLLVGSYAIYLSWGKWFAIVLFASTLANFWIGTWLRKNPSAFVLWIGIVFNLVLLSSFKYIPDLALSLPIASLERFSHIALPLGISFWTFQAMSYLFDLYRGEELDPSFPEFALYMVFFPVVAAGPICRMPDMLPQFRAQEPTRVGDIQLGFRRIAIGVLMMQLARLLGQGILSGDGINSGFDHTTQWSGPDVWCLAAGFGLQLFLDFAGYSHIAIGAARALGFTLPENFSRPFESTSPSIFWTRWHMSLSFWIRDYLFLPLAMLRRWPWWPHLMLVLSMITFGVWHRASLLFILWGGYHGALLVFHRNWQQFERRQDWNPSAPLWNALAWLTTIALISLGWIFFRANSLSQARTMWVSVASPASYLSHTLSTSLYLLAGGIAAGYAVVVYASAAFHKSIESSEGAIVSQGSSMMTLATRGLYFWITPLYLVLLLTLVIVTHTQAVDPAQLMYRNF
jgi:alginate O-acetyltransferase complex protein AlgI